MRLAPFALALAACSSPAATAATTHPADEVAVAIDAAPAEVTVVAPPDADPGPCLPAEADLVEARAGALVLCTSANAKSDYDQCYGVSAAGELVSGDTAEQDELDVEWDDDSVEICTDASCKSIKPKRGKGQKIVEAVPGRNDRLAVAIRARPGAPAAIELWDVATAKRLGHVEVTSAAPELHVAFVGDAILVLGSEDLGLTAEGTLLWFANKKLRKVVTLEGEVRSFASLDASRAAFVLDAPGDAYEPAAMIVDVSTGAKVVDVTWSAIAGAGELAGVEVVEADVPGKTAIALREEVYGPLIGVGLVGVDGVVAPFPVRICAPVPRPMR